MDKIMVALELAVLEAVAEETEMPDEIKTLIKCLVGAGCGLKNVIRGLITFSVEIDKRDTYSLKELLKDLPVDFEEE